MRATRTAYRVACMTAGVALAPLIPLPASTVEWWISELQLDAVVGWIGQKRASNMAFVSYPPYQGIVAPDPPYFRSRPVAWSRQTGGTGSWWRGQGLSPLLILGTHPHPWTYVVGRIQRRPVGQSSGLLASFGVGTTYHQRLGCYLSADSRTYATLGGVTVNGANVDLLPHRYKWWSDSAGGYLRIDEAEWSAAGVYNLSANITSVSAGAGVSVSCMESRVALMVMCGSKPTLGEENALDSWARAYYGLP